LKYKEFIDELSGIQKLDCFFPDNFQQIYGTFGKILYIKLNTSKPDEPFARNTSIVSMLCSVASFFKTNSGFSHYKLDDESYIVVFKENTNLLTDNYVTALNQSFLGHSSPTENNCPWIPISTHLITYTDPILSVADIYSIVFNLYLTSNQSDVYKDLLHSLMNCFSKHMHLLTTNYNKLCTFALHDDISDLPNSKAAQLFFDQINKEEKEYAILFIDGDNLSDFNQVSYDYGNQAIHDIASVISTSIRKTDKVFRWLNGDEFLVYAQDITKVELEILAERIRYNIEAKFLSSPIKATVSIGISLAPMDGKTMPQIISNAELAIKKAKKSGKNQFWLYSNLSVEKHRVQSNYSVFQHK